MLRLSGITKNYKVAGGEIKVLKGMDIAFRQNEFVSILGPSGCGKTTTLNIIGGLDKYTSGDLIIAGKSTKNFTDRDWDVYRNRRIGFIFQSYNLIPHQTVLGNVEIALTISGVSKEERVRRSISALDKVGLKGEYYKRPNQLSGGQCQRVAIARALVNEPDILLADEPTGALDSKTSIQIMDLIKEISKEKLVIMVTHNSEIAEKYSTRIVRLIDGEIVEDTNPFTASEEIDEVNEFNATAKDDVQPVKKKGKKPKAKMSWWTAFKLSARNLLTKRGRTIMTSVAGSIGIIGISAVLAVSSGVHGFIASMQDDMLSGNPITIEESGYDFSSLIEGLSFEKKAELIKQEGYVNVDSMIEYLAKQYEHMNSFKVTNEINEDYIQYIKEMPAEYGTVKLDYEIDVTNNIYSGFNITSSKSETVSLSGIRARFTSILKRTQFSEQSSLISSLDDIFMQSISDSEYILSQYDIVDGGRLATEKDEIMLVLNNDQALTDLTLAQLGYFSQEEFMDLIYRVDEDKENDPESYKDKFSFEELKEKTFVWYSNDIVYNENPSGTDPFGNTVPFTYNDSYTDSDKFNTAGTEEDNEDKIDLKIVGILKPKENISYGCLEAGIYYTEALTEHMIKKNKDSAVVNYMKDEATAIDSYGGMVVVKEEFKTPTYDGSVPVSLSGSSIITYDYLYYYEDYETPIRAKTMVGKLNSFSSILSNMMGSGTTGGDSYSLSRRELGGEELASKISVYPSDFEWKNKVTEYLDRWNEEVDITVGNKTLSYSERTEITYSDTLSLIISMINTMIDVITYALIAFTSLSLVVSCVMIAIITYVSVVERVKEIGVIRSLGGRKKDVSNLFNAETLILGATSGLIGIGFTYVLSAIVNVIVNSAAGFSIMALPFTSALIMIALSIGLTVLSGLIPARKAAHQDPVVALRTE